jgi:hypothetical protein
LTLGGRALVLSKDRITARGYARREFLLAIERNSPEVLTALAQDVLPHYGTGRYEKARLEWAKRFYLTRMLHKNRRVERIGDDITFLQDLEQGPPSWLTKQLELTFTWWLSHPDRRRIRWYKIVSLRTAQELLEFDDLTISLKGIDPGTLGETLRAKRKRWLREVQAAIDEHFARVVESATAQGYVEPDEVTLAYFDWGVQFQVGNRSVPDILPKNDRHGDVMDERTDRRGIAIVLDLIGLDRRLERPGPKAKKSRTS